MVGLDEVGRGCLAGPLLVVAARRVSMELEGLADSKILNRTQRETFYKLLLANYRFGEGWVSPHEIDKRGLSRAMRLGVKRALRQLNVPYSEEIIMDGPVNYFSRRYTRVRCIIRADENIPLVSAASIYAKVKRDSYMKKLAVRHSGYGFDTNFGYGTREHLKALSYNGSLKKVHRELFKPVAIIQKEEPIFDEKRI